MCQFSFISNATELHQCNASKLWAYLIQTPANQLIYKEPGYNLKVRGSNLLPATTSLIINNIFPRFILFCQTVTFQSKMPPTYPSVVTLSGTTQVFLASQPCLYPKSMKTWVCGFLLLEFTLLQHR